MHNVLSSGLSAWCSFCFWHWVSSDPARPKLAKFYFAPKWLLTLKQSPLIFTFRLYQNTKIKYTSKYLFLILSLPLPEQRAARGQQASSETVLFPLTYAEHQKQHCLWELLLDRITRPQWTVPRTGRQDHRVFKVKQNPRTTALLTDWPCLDERGKNTDNTNKSFTL